MTVRDITMNESSSRVKTDYERRRRFMQELNELRERYGNETEIWIEKGERRINLKNGAFFCTLLLDATPGDEIRIIVDGEEEHQAAAEFADFIERTCNRG